MVAKFLVTSVSDSRTMVLHLILISFLSVLGCAKRPSQELSDSKSAESTRGKSKTVAIIETPTPPAPTIAKQLPAEDLTIIGRYRQASGYSDRASLNLAYLLEDGRREENTTQIETRYAGPNRIHLRISSEDNLVTIVSDGKRIAARIMDPMTRDFDGQVVIREAPDNLAIASLYQVTELVDPISPNEILSALLNVPAGLDVLPLSFLMNEGKLTELASAKTPHASLGKMALPSGEQCNVIEAQAEEGPYRFWIADDTLRRIELPPLTRNLLPGVRQMELVVNFEEVHFAVADSDFHVDDSGTKVNHFVLPIIPQATDKLGKEIQGLSFHNRDGNKVQIANSEGQITVLAWFRDRPESRMVLESIEQVRRRNRSDRVRFAAVAHEPTATHQLLEKWKVETAWLQDRLAQGRDLLGIEQAPTVCVLGANNSVQYFEVGANPSIGANIAAVVERLLAGQDVARETRASAQDAEIAYTRILARAKIDGDGWTEELDAAIPDAVEPKLLELKEVWATDEVKEPGNFLIVPGKRKQILVADGWNHVVLLGLNGKITRRIELELPPDEGITILRAGSNGRDRALIAAASRGGRRAFVFDFAGKLETQYPPDASEQFAISDIAIHDIEGNKDPELIVGWQGSGGVHGVGLDGKKHWSNQATPGVISIAAVRDETSGNKRQPILVAGESGLMFLVDEDGRTLREVRLDQVIHQLVTWPGNARGFEAILSRDNVLAGQNGAIHIGVSSSALGARVVTGIDRDWKAIWTHPMPSGVYRHQVDFPQTMTIPDIGPTWLMPGADGSIHFLSIDGKFRDVLYVGSHIRGLVGTQIDGKPVLLVATDEKLRALEVSAAQADAQADDR